MSMALYAPNPDPLTVIFDLGGPADGDRDTDGAAHAGDAMPATTTAHVAITAAGRRSLVRERTRCMVPPSCHEDRESSTGPRSPPMGRDSRWALRACPEIVSNPSNSEQW